MSSEAAGEPTLLIVDDDATFRTALGQALAKSGFAVSLAESAEEAAAMARGHVFEYALVDVRMPGQSGIDLVGTLRSMDDGIRIVVFTGYGTIANAVAAIRAGAVDYLTKPVDAAQCARSLLGVAPAARGDGDEDLPSLDRVEWEYLQRVLADCEGNISEAARKLRMHRRSLQRKLSRLPPRS
ncbi:MULTISPECIES: response regulator transcription factor [Sorangium]|uniref:Response regulator receiver domain n=1 Tax=Sorangium cellulosum (strain So ce56) TaxID=448385 RepID=A9FHJ0_SORC5|nr:response regulator [Sorangium cellulosum]CAN98221.1 Response regulator receiver domain [Sorangium cellulosum So ce56]